jgi:hypothetical protein
MEVVGVEDEEEEEEDELSVVGEGNVGGIDRLRGKTRSRVIPPPATSPIHPDHTKRKREEDKRINRELLQDQEMRALNL